MRWFVEISSIGKNAPASTTVCVEAPQWQPALQMARALRGDEGALSNFSIELLDDGYRAIDPSTRVKYVVRKAPDDAILTNGNVAARSISEPPKKPSTRPPGPKSAAPPASTAAGRAQLLSSLGATAAASPAAAPAARDAKPNASPRPDPTSPRPSPASPATNAAAKAPLQPTAPKPAQPTPLAGTASAMTAAEATAAKPQRGPAQTRTYASSGAAAIAEPPAPPRAAEPRVADGVAKRRAEGTVNYMSPGTAAVHDAASQPALPTFTVANSRQEEPSARSPLSYREQAYSVAEGTSEEAARALVVDRLRQIVDELRAAPTGKLVNLAVFDHAFRGRPQRPPLVTLTWKDWKGTEPEIRFPLREGPGNTPTPLAAGASPSGPPPVPSSFPPPAAAPAPDAPAPISAPMSAPMSAPFKAVAEIPSSRTSRKPEPAPPPEPVVADEPVPLVRDEPVPLVRDEPVPLVRRSDAPLPADAMPLVTARGASDRPPPEAAPAPDADVARAPAGGRRHTPRSISTSRLAGDELLAELFEAFNDLHFLADTLAGADFVLGLAIEKLPSEVGILSMFDINRREFVVVRQMGAQRSAVLSRLPERSPIAEAAMRTRRAVVIPNAKEDAHAHDERWATIGTEVRSLVCAPIMLGGRYLGLLELANPLDGGEFTDGDGHALTYIGQQFAEFVATHGVVTDADHIGKGHLQPA
jgi:hypothetical protein